MLGIRISIIVLLIFTIYRLDFGSDSRPLVSSGIDVKPYITDCGSGVPDIPTGRSDVCTVLVTAQDKSSFNIYVIAGVGKVSSFTVKEDLLSNFQKPTIASLRTKTFGCSPFPPSNG